jgi:hypothetical protein
MKFELKTNPWEEEGIMGSINIWGKKVLSFFFVFFAQIQLINFPNFVGKLTKFLR